MASNFIEPIPRFYILRSRFLSVALSREKIDARFRSPRFLQRHWRADSFHRQRNAGKLASDGNGSISVLEDVSPPRNGPPLHSHGFEEFFYVIRGRFLVELDGQQTHVDPGDMVHVPAHMPHTFQNVSDEEGRLLIIVRPGGIERYFAKLAEQMIQDASNTTAFAQLAADYGIAILGPPISARKP